MKTFNDRSITLDVAPTDRIRDIKNRIDDTEGISIDRQRLLFAGARLDDSVTLEDYSIKNGSKLNLELRSRDVIVIFVRKGIRSPMSMEVKADDTIGKIKQMIDEEEGIPFYRQRLTFAGRNLEDTKTLQEYSIGAGSTIQLEVIARSERGFGNIIVKKLSGKHLEFEVELTMPTEHLKFMISDREGIPPEDQKLIFAGRQMDDDNTFAHYGVTYGSTVHLVMRLRG